MVTLLYQGPSGSGAISAKDAMEEEMAHAFIDIRMASIKMEKDFGRRCRDILQGLRMSMIKMEMRMTKLMMIRNTLWVPVWVRGIPGRMVEGPVDTISCKFLFIQIRARLS